MAGYQDLLDQYRKLRQPQEIPSAEDITSALQGPMPSGEPDAPIQASVPPPPPAPEPIQPAAPPQAPDDQIMPINDFLKRIQDIQSAPKPEANQDLVNAIKQQTEMNRSANIGDAFSRIGAGIAGLGAGSIVKPDLEAYNPSRAMGQQGVQDVQMVQNAADKDRDKQLKEQQQKIGTLEFARKSQIDEKNRKSEDQKRQAQITEMERKAEIEKELDNPESPTSMFYRELAKKQLPGVPIPDGLSARHIMKLKLGPGANEKGSYQQSVVLGPDGETKLFKFNTKTGEVTPTGDFTKGYAPQVKKDPRSGELIAIQPAKAGATPTQVPSLEGKPSNEKKDITFQDLNPAQREQLKETEKEYRADVKDAREMGETINGLDNLINADIPAAIPAIKRQLARSVGREVGVMTDQDVQQFSGDPSLIAALERFATLKASGKLTDRDKQQYQQIIALTKRNLNTAIDKNGSYHANRLSQRVPGASEQSLKGLLSVEASKPEGIQAEPDVEAYAKKHNISIQQAQQIKQQRMNKQGRK